MSDIAYPLIAYIADGRCITEAEAAAIVDALRVPAPVVPDDVARLREALEEIDRNIPEYYTECFGIRAIVRAALTHPTGEPT